MKTKSLELILAFALVSVVISGFAHTWKLINPLGYAALGMSADGRIICAMPSFTHPIVSTNSGTTWNTQNGFGDATLDGIALSADGSKFYASLVTNGFPRIFVSTDLGSNWTQTPFPAGVTLGSAVACSTDGTNVIVGLRNLGIYYSTNGAVDCYTSSAPALAWSAVASSADGSRMVASANPGNVYFSQDLGVTWTPSDLPSTNWNSVCVSRNGKWVGAVSGTNSYISSDAGVSWQTNQLAGKIIACSADGAHWLITGSQVYISNDYGSNWQTNLATTQWYGGTVSADGCEMVVTGSGQGMFLGSLTPSPQLSIQSQNPNVTVSWLIPSTNFVLQQSTNLSKPNWTPVSITPTLNFTNLNQQVTVPANGSNLFFRLSAQ